MFFFLSSLEISIIAQKKCQNNKQVQSGELY